MSDVEAVRDDLLAQAAQHEVPPGALCLRLARALAKLGDGEGALGWALRVVDADDDFTAWQGAAALLPRLDTAPGARRSAKVAVLGSSTTSQLVAMLRLAARAGGVDLELYEAGYGQYRQEVLDPASGMYRFGPDLVVLAVHAGEVQLPALADDPAAAVDAEVARWASLWDAVRAHGGARVIQHGFAVPPEAPFGHLGLRLPGVRTSMLHALNARLGEAAGDDVALVDCDRLASWIGKAQWFDARYWHLSKQAVSLGATPLLARHLAAVVAAELGLTRKCLVLDLDNTLWGGVVGEDGLAGIALGGTARGEAFLAFQDHVLALKARGVILAVCSKNNDADAREVFTAHPDMRIRLEDVACFSAGWAPKHEQLRRIAEELDLGLDALVFVDDNPAEREVVRQHLPEVDVLALPPDPAGYVAALAAYPRFEAATFTDEDRRRTEQYRGRAQVREAAATATSLDEFHRSLEMVATVRPLDERDLPRVAQLMGKTNQFNLTTRRHGPAELERFAADPDVVALTLRLRDRFTDHGLVSVLIAVPDGGGEALEVDSWLMSCRVIGRTVEQELLQHLTAEALRRGHRRITATYRPTQKNAMVADLYPRLGFTAEPAGDGDGEGVTRWAYDVAALGATENPFIDSVVDGLVDAAG